MSDAVRFVRGWNMRVPGQIDRGLPRGVMATLVQHGIAVWEIENGNRPQQTATRDVQSDRRANRRANNTRQPENSPPGSIVRLR